MFLDHLFLEKRVIVYEKNEVDKINQHEIFLGYSFLCFGQIQL